MKRLSYLLGLFCLFLVQASAQDPPVCYRIYLSDKNGSPYSVDRPSDYLSARALRKRARFQIAVTEEDLPVNPQYLQQIAAVDPSVSILCCSKWMNTATVYCPDSSKLAGIRSLPFVSGILPVADILPDSATFASDAMPEKTPTAVHRGRDSGIASYDYGFGYGQIALHNGHLLHNEGFRGDSMLIAVFDGGWEGVDTDEFFAPLRDSGHLAGTRDLMPGLDNVFMGHYHGTIVTSTMAGRQEGVLVGTAPEADYFLIRSEHTPLEQLIEEDFWARAAEIADSLGADVINSSLGYTTFEDFPQGDFTYADMDGESSVASSAATKLAARGVVVCISAGNYGADPWHYIGHPCDAKNVLAVGAADIYGNIADFSSRGPSSDGRVKPDITSVGVNTVCCYPGSRIGGANGTSLAGPVAAGLCACLWQALPEMTSTELMQAVREAGSCYENPNDSLGYGIPDFYAAYLTHSHSPSGMRHYTRQSVEVYPTPCGSTLHIANPRQTASHIRFYNMQGMLVKTAVAGNGLLTDVGVGDLPDGIYIGIITCTDGHRQNFKMVKAAK